MPRAVLHPQHKLQYFRDENWPEEWITEAVDLLRAEWTEYYKPAPPEVPNNSESADAPAATSSKGKGKGKAAREFLLLSTHCSGLTLYSYSTFGARYRPQERTGIDEEGERLCLRMLRVANTRHY